MCPSPRRVAGCPMVNGPSTTGSWSRFFARWKVTYSSLPFGTMTLPFPPRTLTLALPSIQPLLFFRCLFHPDPSALWLFSLLRPDLWNSSLFTKWSSLDSIEKARSDYFLVEEIFFLLDC